MTSNVAEPGRYGQEGYAICWNEGKSPEKFKQICDEGLKPQNWPWVHCRAPFQEYFGIQHLPRVEPGFYRIVIVVVGSQCKVMSSERNSQHRYDYPLMQSGMLPLADHFKLCDKIDRFKEQNRGKNVFVNTMTKQMNAVEWGVLPQRPWTDTSFRRHSEIHVESVDPSHFLLAYYCPESAGQPIIIWNADSPLANKQE